MQAVSVYFARRDGVGAAGGHAGRTALIAPATPERILMACEAGRAAR